MKTTIFFQKFAGILSTTLLIIGSLSPNTFHIPPAIHQWFFLVTIAWILLMVSGVLNP